MRLSESIVLIEVDTGNIYLSVSFNWTATWLEAINLWCLEVEEWSGSGVESIVSVLDNELNPSWSVVWWGCANDLVLGYEHSWYSGNDTSIDTNWVSDVTEFVTINVLFPSTGSWTLCWGDFNNTWWVEEKHLNTFGIVLVVQSQLDRNTHEWWVEVIWFGLALCSG